VNPFLRLFSFLRYLAAAEELGAEIPANEGDQGVGARAASGAAGAGRKQGMIARLLAAEQLPPAEPQAAPRPATPKVRWLRWLLAGETLPAAPQHPAARQPGVGSLTWLLSGEDLPWPDAAPARQSGFHGVNMSWLLAGEPLEPPDEVKEPGLEQRFDHE
jgi:hypothetical protein